MHSSRCWLGWGQGHHLPFLTHSSCCTAQTGGGGRPREIPQDVRVDGNSVQLAGGRASLTVGGGPDWTPAMKKCLLVEAGQVIQVSGPPTPSPDPGGTHSFPVRIQGSILQAIVYLGCMYLNLVWPWWRHPQWILGVCMAIFTSTLWCQWILDMGGQSIAVRLRLVTAWSDPKFWTWIGPGLIG